MKNLLLLALLCLPLASHAAPKAKTISATAIVSQTEAENPPASQLPPDIKITDATIPAAAIGQSPAVSLLLFNPTSATIVIRGATSPAAQLIRLQHLSKTPEGLAQMEILAKLIIPAGTNAVLTPGQTELRLLNLTTPLQAGYETPLTLLFLNGTSKTIRLHITD